MYIYKFGSTHHFVVHDPHHGTLFVLLIHTDNFLAIGHQTPLLRLQQQPLEVACAVPRIPSQIELLEGAWQDQWTLHLYKLIPTQVEYPQGVDVLEGAR